MIKLLKIGMNKNKSFFFKKKKSIDTIYMDLFPMVLFYYYKFLKIVKNGYT